MTGEIYSDMVSRLLVCCWLLGEFIEILYSRVFGEAVLVSNPLKDAGSLANHSWIQELLWSENDSLTMISHIHVT